MLTFLPAISLPTILFLIGIPFASTSYAAGFIMGAIQFPHAVNDVPVLPVFVCGQRIPLTICGVDNDSKRFIYQVPHVAIQPPLFLVIMETPVGYKKNDDSENNTIDYLTIPKDTSYKLYNITRSPENRSSYWHVQEVHVDEKTRKLPDETIIIYYDPLLIDRLDGGNQFELPTIYLKPNLLDLLGSEEHLHQQANCIALAAIDSNAIHICPKPAMAHIKNTILIAPLL